MFVSGWKWEGMDLTIDVRHQVCHARIWEGPTERGPKTSTKCVLKWRNMQQEIYSLSYASLFELAMLVSIMLCCIRVVACFHISFFHSRGKFCLMLPVFVRAEMAGYYSWMLDPFQEHIYSIAQYQLIFLIYFFLWSTAIYWTATHPGWCSQWDLKAWKQLLLHHMALGLCFLRWQLICASRELA